MKRLLLAIILCAGCTSQPDEVQEALNQPNYTIMKMTVTGHPHNEFNGKTSVVIVYPALSEKDAEEGRKQRIYIKNYSK